MFSLAEDYVKRKMERETYLQSGFGFVVVVIFLLIKASLDHISLQEKSFSSG